MQLVSLLISINNETTTKGWFHKRSSRVIRGFRTIVDNPRLNINNDVGLTMNRIIVELEIPHEGRLVFYAWNSDKVKPATCRECAQSCATENYCNLVPCFETNPITLQLFVLCVLPFLSSTSFELSILFKISTARWSTKIICLASLKFNSGNCLIMADVLSKCCAPIKSNDSQHLHPELRLFFLLPFFSFADLWLQKTFR